MRHRFPSDCIAGLLADRGLTAEEVEERRCVYGNPRACLLRGSCGQKESQPNLEQRAQLVYLEVRAHYPVQASPKRDDEPEGGHCQCWRTRANGFPSYPTARARRRR